MTANPIYEQTWRDRHMSALREPRTLGERDVQALLQTFANIVNAHRGDQFVRRQVLDPLAETIRGYLNLDIGRLDGGTVEKTLDDYLTWYDEDQ